MYSLFLVLLCAFAGVVQAAPIQYRLEFEVTGIQAIDLSRLARPPAIGDEYFGTLAVDETVLAAGGVHDAPVSAFTAQVGDALWTTELPRNTGENALLGFRSATRLLTQEVIGVEVSNGELVRLIGGVFGFGDAEFMDFDFRDPLTWMSRAFFECLPAACGLPGVDISVGFSGEYSVTRLLPLPATSLLLATALILIAITGQRQRRC